MDFDHLQQIMPNLIGEMAEDLALDTENEMDEFIILAHEREKYDSQTPRFVYYENKHPDLKSQVALLEKEGYIHAVSKEEIPIYRMTQDFQALLANQ